MKISPKTAICSHYTKVRGIARKPFVVKPDHRA